MPELPEVETIARLIRPKLVGRTIEGARVRWTRTLGGASPRAFSKDVRGARVERVWRRGKFVVVDLVRGSGRAAVPAGALVVHLRMTGRLHVEPADADPGPYARVSLALDDGTRLDFVDVRKFGRFRFAQEPGQLLAELGPEPLSADFTPEAFHAGLCARRRVLKPLLLDQTFVAGIGNIYADEALFRAGLHPERRSDRLSPQATRRLWTEIRAVLAEAIEREGSSFDTFYRTPEGQPGSYQHQFRVYGRTGQPCRACGRPVVRIVVAQRGTHLCRKCQPRCQTRFRRRSVSGTDARRKRV